MPVKDATVPIRISFTSSSAAIAETEKATNNAATQHTNSFFIALSSFLRALGFRVVITNSFQTRHYSTIMLALDIEKYFVRNFKGYQRALFLEKGFTPNPKKKGEAPMKVDISVPKVVSIFEEHQAQLEKFFEMISIDMR
jgi:hypothetical protein